MDFRKLKNNALPYVLTTASKHLDSNDAHQSSWHFVNIFCKPLTMLKNIPPWTLLWLEYIVSNSASYWDDYENEESFFASVFLNVYMKYYTRFLSSKISVSVFHTWRQHDTKIWESSGFQTIAKCLPIEKLNQFIRIMASRMENQNTFPPKSLFEFWAVVDNEFSTSDIISNIKSEKYTLEIGVL